MKFNDLTGQRFNRLVVLSRTPNNNSRATMFNCICDCGQEKIVRSSHLIDGLVGSCGCLNSELSRERTLKHGRTGSSEYRVWSKIKRRCNAPHDHKYSMYGGRGISVCDRWAESFENFFEDMGCRPANHSIDRIDNMGDYTPDNCRWATPKQQARNTRRNVIIEYDGLSLCVSEWAERVGLKAATLHSRLRSGWTVEKALNKPV